MDGLAPLTGPPRLRQHSGGVRPVRIMIVDDSMVARTVLTRILQGEPDLEIVAKATTAETALARLEELRVDVILLDLEMPGIGGIVALPEILKRGRGAKVLVVSTLTAAGAEHTLKALSIGAADTLLKPRTGEFDTGYGKTLVAKIRALASHAGSRGPTALRATPALSMPVPAHREFEVIAIGASTGGIHALCLLLGALPDSVDLPIVVVQHLPESFMPTLARQLTGACGRPAVVASADTPILPGRIHVAPGDGHLVVRREANRLVAGIARHPVASGCTPSVDPLFESLAQACGNRAIGAVLSGMGRDGAIGAVDLVRAGGVLFAQDAATSAVWGMPRAVVEAGLASVVAPPEDIARRIGAMTAIAAPRRA